MLIYKFTLKRNRTSNVETHYVRHSSSEQAKTELAKHLGIDETIISFNPKNLPFKVRNKVLSGVVETDEKGNTVKYGLTLDFSKDVQAVESADRDVKQQQITTEFAVGLVDSIYNTIKYDLQAMYQEDKKVLKKYGKTRDAICIDMRNKIVSNNLQDRMYNEHLSIIEAIDYFHMSLQRNKK